MADDPHTSERFEWIDRVARDRHLSAFAKTVVMILAGHLNRQTGDAWPSQETIAAALGATDRGVRKALEQLEARGHIRTQRQGARLSNRYSIGLGLAEDRLPEIASQLSDAMHPDRNGGSGQGHGDRNGGSYRRRSDRNGGSGRDPSDRNGGSGHDEVTGTGVPIGVEVTGTVVPVGGAVTGTGVPVETLITGTVVPVRGQVTGTGVPPNPLKESLDKDSCPTEASSFASVSKVDGRPPRGVGQAPTAAELAEFTAWWSVYPRREAKPRALAAYARARRAGADADTLIAGAKRMAASGREVQFMPLPANYLNDRRWEDELPPVVAGTASQPPRAPTWQGPPEIRAAVVELRDDGFAASYLDTGSWDPETRTIIPRGRTASARLREKVGDQLKALGVSIREIAA